MSNSPILNLPLVDPNQTQKETTINTALAILEAASNDKQDYDATSADVTADQDQFTKHLYQRVFGHTVARNFTVPATKRMLIVHNDGTGAVTVKCLGSSGLTVVVPASKIVIMISDGTDILALSSGVGRMADLSDVDISAITSGEYLKWNGTEFVGDAGTGGGGGGGATVFTDLTDVPSAYTSAGLKIVRVNTGATALEFVDIKTAMILGLSAPTTDYNMATADLNAVVQMDSATAVNYTVEPGTTTPMALGSQIVITQKGVGQVTIVAGAGVTLLYPSDLTLATRIQYSAVTIIKVDADVWHVIGDLAS